MSPSRNSPFSAIADYAASLVDRAATSGHRAVLVLSGERQWCRDAAGTIVTSLHFTDLYWLGETPPGLDVHQPSVARALLGREIDGVVIDAWSGFDVEAFGAVAGSLQAGGLFLLLTPPLSRWRDYPDPEHRRLAVTPYKLEDIGGRFLQRVVNTLTDCQGIVVLREGEAPPVLDRLTGPRWQPHFTADGMTPEQKEAVAGIAHVVHGHRRRPLVLTSDRGRGKTASLGIAAAQLLQESLSHIVVTAPRLSAVNALFDHADRLLPGAQRERGVLTWQGRCIEFVPPDALILSPLQTDLLLVDEAAAIPTSLLERILARYARIVFASTIHGYEGTGRGFALRFQKVLSRRTPGWRSLQLNRPVRWAEDDPLERLSFQALMLDAEMADEEAVSGADVEHCRLERLDRSQLIEGGCDLSELFGLLVLAHYRTSPNDLRYLLDGPDVRIYVLRHRGHIVATAVVAEEGGLTSELAQGIYAGRRRAHGHLLAQSLAVHAGFVEAPVQRAWRVVRIAVHPSLTRQGLGRHLLQQLKQRALEEGLDYLGASFGADAPLLAFWLDHGWLPVRIGLSRDVASGTHSVMVMKALSLDAESLFHALQARLAEQLPLLLSEPLAEFDADLTAAIYQHLPAPGFESMSVSDWRDVYSFARAFRGYEVCLLSLWRLTQVVLGDSTLVACLEERQCHLLVQKVLQRHDWRSVSATLGMRGKNEVIEALRACFSNVLDYYRESHKLPPEAGLTI